jgi:hypothetical protein
MILIREAHSFCSFILGEDYFVRRNSFVPSYRDSLVYLLISVASCIALPAFAESTPLDSLHASPSTNLDLSRVSDTTTNQLTDVTSSNATDNDVSTLVTSESLSTNSATADLTSADGSATPSAIAPVSDSDTPGPMSQLTSVSQLSDVQPTDWAFQAVQSLVERYGCIAGYPDGTFRGNRALTRYEFAAGLNACLDRVNELIASGLANAVTRQDLATIQRLQEEFAAELATLRGRVDSLEARTAELEANQFSTTTKLSGEIIFGLAGATGSYPGSDRSNTTPGILTRGGTGAPGNDAQITFLQRTRLNLNTSFNGRDLLITGLQSYSFSGDPNSIQGTLGYSDVLGLNSSQVRLGFEPEFPGTDPQTLRAVNGGNFRLYKLLYIFPSGLDNLTFFAGTNAEESDAFPSVAPFFSESQGGISRFSIYNPVIRVSGGTSGTGLAAAVGLIWTPAPWFDFRALYASVNAPINRNVPLDAASFAAGTATPLGAGFFSGSTVVSTQLTLKPTPALDIGINYAHSYHQINILGTGLTSGDIGAVLFNPSQRCSTVGFFAASGGFGCSTTPNGGVDTGATVLTIGSEPIEINSVGATATWRFTRNLSITASGALLFADLVNVNASTTFSSWLFGLHAQDLFGKGNSGAIIFGKPLSRSDTGGRALSPFEDTTPYQLEGYVNLRLTDNINITPGAFAVFNPEGYSGNDTAVVGVVRTTFRF